MNIVVFLKTRLDADAPFVISDSCDRLDGLLLPEVVDPADLHAFAEVRAAYPRGGKARVVAVGMGPSGEKAARAALSLNADEAVVVGADQAGLDGNPELRAVLGAAAARTLKADVVVCGRNDAWGVLDEFGALMAESLGFAQASGVSSVEARSDGRVGFKRRLDHGDREIAVCPTPAVLVFDGAADSLPYPAMPLMLRARLSKVAHLGTEELGLKGADLLVGRGVGAATFQPPRPRTKRSPEKKKSRAQMMQAMMGGGKKKAGNVVEGSPEEAAERVVAFLKERGMA